MEKIISALKNAKSVAIFMHIRPDGDTIGSSLALCLALKMLGKKVQIYCEDLPSQKFSFLQGCDGIIDSDILDKYDAYLAVDCSDEYRLGKYINDFLRQRNTLVVDHHKSNTKFASICYVCEKAAATAILAMKIIKHLGIKINKDIAECLYTGLSTDTGNFSHANTDKQVFSLACELIECDIDVSNITTMLYKNSSKARIKLLGKVISNMRFYDNDTVSIITITRNDIDSIGATAQDTEGFIDYAVGIEGVSVACCLLEHSSNCYKVSLRSKGVDVCKIAMEFGGGGHMLASGCMINGFYEDVIDKLIRAIGNN